MSFGNNQATKKRPGWNVRETVKVPAGSVNANRGRVDLDPTKVQTFIEQKGIRLNIFRTMYCPNVKSADGAEHEIDCVLCNGSGYVDVDPICVNGMIQTQELETIPGNAGYHDGNTVLITFESGVELQYFTRIEIADFTDLYYQRVMRKPGTNTDVLKYKCCRVNSVIDQNGLRYNQDQDFRIDGNGSILWLTRKPADNVIYAIHFECHIGFRAVKANHVSRFTQYRNEGEIEYVKLPEQWMCIKEFMIRRKDDKTNTDLSQGPYSQWQDTTGQNDDQP